MFILGVRGEGIGGLSCTLVLVFLTDDCGSWEDRMIIHGVENAWPFPAGEDFRRGVASP